MKFKNMSKKGNLHFAIFLSHGERVLEEELNVLTGTGPRCFLKLQRTGAGRIDYTGSQMLPLRKFFDFPMSRYGFFTFVEEVVTTFRRCGDLYLDPSRLILNPSWIYVQEQTAEPYFAYFPAEQVSSKDNVSLLKEQQMLVFLAELVNLCIPVPGQGSEYLVDFYRFLKSLRRFDASAVEDYIIRIDENIYHNVKSRALLAGQEPSSRSVPRLIRLGTGESVPVNQPVFRVGKEYASVDFCIGGNSAVSRLHVDIICHEGKYFVKDLNSRNKTYLNGDEIPAMTEVPLQTGSELVLANEAFLFGY